MSVLAPERKHKCGDFVTFPFTGKDGNEYTVTARVQGSVWHAGRELVTVKVDPGSPRTVCLPASVLTAVPVPPKVRQKPGRKAKAKVAE